MSRVTDCGMETRFFGTFQVCHCDDTCKGCSLNGTAEVFDVGFYISTGAESSLPAMIGSYNAYVNVRDLEMRKAEKLRKKTTCPEPPGIESELGDAMASNLRPATNLLDLGSNKWPTPLHHEVSLSSRDSQVVLEYFLEQHFNKIEMPNGISGCQVLV